MYHRLCVCTDPIRQEALVAIRRNRGFTKLPHIDYNAHREISIPKESHPVFHPMADREAFEDTGYDAYHWLVLRILGCLPGDISSRGACRRA